MRFYPQHTKDGVLRKMGLDTKGKQTRLTDDEYDIFNILKGDKKMTEIDQTIKRAKPTPVAKEVEKTQSFTAAFASDAHVAAERAFADSDVQIVSTEESDAGDAGTTVTVTFK